MCSTIEHHLRSTLKDLTFISCQSGALLPCVSGGNEIKESLDAPIMDNHLMSTHTYKPVHTEIHSEINPSPYNYKIYTVKLNVLWKFNTTRATRCGHLRVVIKMHEFNSFSFYIFLNIQLIPLHEHMNAANIKICNYYSYSMHRVCLH